MSCFILSDESTAALAAMLDRAANAAHWSGTAAKSELYLTLSQVKNYYMQYLIGIVPEYSAAVWG